MRIVEWIKQRWHRSERQHQEVLERLDRIADGVWKLVEERRARHAATRWKG